MKTLRIVAIAVALSASDARSLRAQDARISARFDARTAAAVTRVVDSARAARLPTEPIIQKALQGAAKRAPSERVVGALRELLRELSVARAALGARSSEPELVAGASALHAGIEPGTLKRVRDARGSHSATVALGTLSDLVARGGPAEAAANAVLALAGRGASDAEFVAFSGQVGRDIAAGAPPAVAVGVRGAAAAQGARPAAGRPPTVTPTVGGRRPAPKTPPGRP